MPAPTLFERASKYVAKMPDLRRSPDDPQNSHNELLTAACVCVQGFGLSRGDARAILEEYTRRSDQPWTAAEIEHKLDAAEAMPGLQTKDGLQPRGCLAGDRERDDGPRAERPPSQAPSAALPIEQPKKPQFEPEKLREFAGRWRGLIDTSWLADRSPIAPYSSAGRLSADDYLRSLYRDGEKVVVFTNQMSQGQALWPLQALPMRGDEGVWYLAQPVDGREYPNPRSRDEDGQPKLSRRSEESVTAWRYLVLESDRADAKDWMAALVQLPLAITAIYTSGGRSIHALVRLDSPTKQEWDNVVKQLKPVLIPLGADPGAMSAVRLTRLPGCLRGERLQKLLYLNPAPTTVPLSIAPRLRDVLTPWLRGAEAILGFAPDFEFTEEDRAMCQRVWDALRWFESAPAAREMIAKLDEWRGAN